MKQKFLLTKNMDKNEFGIEERSELEPGLYSKLYENIYDLDEIQKAEKISAEKLKSVILNNSFYPASKMADLIVEGVHELLFSETEDTLEVLAQDKEIHIAEEEEKPENDAEETVKLDTLLDDAIDDDEGLTEELEISSEDTDSPDYNDKASLKKKGNEDTKKDSSEDSK